MSNQCSEPGCKSLAENRSLYCQKHKCTRCSQRGERYLVESDHDYYVGPYCSFHAMEDREQNWADNDAFQRVNHILMVSRKPTPVDPRSCSKDEVVSCADDVIKVLHLLSGETLTRLARAIVREERQRSNEEFPSYTKVTTTLIGDYWHD